MDFLINRTNILEALLSDNPKIVENLGDLGKLLLNLIRDCHISRDDHYLTQLNNQLMFDEVFAKVISTANTFLMKCLTGESGRGQHMCKENELIYAHITYDDFPDAYEGVESEFMKDFGDILLDNGFKEITDDLKHIANELDFDVENTRSFIYTVNKFGREFAPIFDQIVQYNMDLEFAAEKEREQENDMNPDHLAELEDVGYKYYVSYTFNRLHSSKSGLQIGNQVVMINNPINVPEAITGLAEYIEQTVEGINPGSVTILAFSYMGIERLEEPEDTEPVNEPEDVSDDFYLDEEDGDIPAVEPVKKDNEGGKTNENV